VVGIKAKWKISFVILTIVTFLSGCFVSGCFGEKQALAPLKDGKQKIKVLYHTKGQFNRDYGKLFKAKYPNIDVQVIPIIAKDNSIPFYQVDQQDEEKIKKLIEQHQPDVLLLNENLFTSYMQADKLYSLEEAIVQDQFDLTGYMPGLIDNLREKGNGKLYTLTPSFRAPVLYYNRDLFTENNIEFPRNQMSWEEILILSKKFQGIGTGKNQVSGLYRINMSGVENNPLFFNDVASTFPLHMFDAKAKKLLIHSDGWKKVFKLTTDAIRSQAVSFTPPRSSIRELFAFENGKAAMTINGPMFIHGLEDPIRHGSETKKINWDIVTAPIDPQNPNEAADIRFGGMYAVLANSPNKRAAWEFVKFVNGTEMEKISSRSRHKSLSTRNQLLKEIKGRSVEPFYKLKPMLHRSDLRSHENVPQEFYDLYRPLLKDALKAIVANKKTVDEALAELQVKGQNALVQTQAGKNPNRPMKKHTPSPKHKGGKKKK